MNPRERFRQTMSYGNPDRPPLFEEGIREGVWQIWRDQGRLTHPDLTSRFPWDPRQELFLNLDPLPALERWPSCQAELVDLQKRLDPETPGRWPDDWPQLIGAWRECTDVLMLRVHEGFFLSMGVQGWGRFEEVVTLLIQDPDFVRATLAIQAELAARLAEQVLSDVQIDAAIFSEPIACPQGPLISPQMYERFVLASYQPLLEVLARFEVPTIILRTYANTRILLPGVLRSGFNCLWACECGSEAMDYRAIREEFGQDLRLIGGLDLDVLRQGKAEIERAIFEIVPPLIADGGYAPLIDGRIREGVSFDNYLFYRTLLGEVVQKR